MKNRIAFRLLIYFSAVLLVFSLLSSLLFQASFSRHVMEAKKEQMIKRAESISETLGGVVSGKSGAGNFAQGSGYGSYIRMLSLLEQNVWVLNEDLQFLSLGRSQGHQIQYGDLPPDADVLVQEVFKGQTTFSEGFSALLGVPTLTVGTPVYTGHKVTGAVLLHDSVSGVEDAASQGIRISLLSALVALVLSIIPVILLSLSFTKPIKRMETTALLLSQGDYTQKTGLKQKDEIGDLANSIDVLSDKLAEAREDHEKQERLRREFFANVSHELRTPVTVLRGSLEALCENVVTDEEQMKEYYHRMHGETKNLERLINDLLELSRLQNQDFPIDKEEINLSEPLHDAVRSAERLAFKRNIRLVSDFPEKPLPMMGDYGRLRQMFLIILDNAIKFSPENSSVWITMTESEISFRDEGCGIDPEDLPHVFDRFHKAKHHNAQGSGLGLAIARQIALRHHMELGIKSDQGKGSLFYLKL